MEYRSGSEVIVKIFPNKFYCCGLLVIDSEKAEQEQQQEEFLEKLVAAIM